MSNLIDRQAAIDYIDAVFPVDPMKSEYAQGIACGAALAKTYIKQLPSAQPERKTEYDYSDGFADGYRQGQKDAEPEIIRCKDCKYWMPHSQLGYDEDNETYHDYCEKLIPEDEYYAFYRDADDYCSRAERRTDG